MSDELTAETRIRIFGEEIDRLNARLRKADEEIERLRSYTDACNTLLAERVEIECMRGLAVRAWHSFRSGLTATGGCRDGLTDCDILELAKLSNTDAAKAGATKL